MFCYCRCPLYSNNNFTPIIKVSNIQCRTPLSKGLPLHHDPAGIQNPEEHHPYYLIVSQRF
jgi:hypothetical protein